MPFFRYQGQRIHYTEFASDVKPPAQDARAAGAHRGAATNGTLGAAKGRPLILLHGLMLSQEMHRPLAEELARRGNRVITMDLLGHGRSDRPRDMWRYSMAIFGEQIIGLMDHLELEQAAVMGTSLGANAALEVASQHPERLRGMVIEMPVLDNGLLASALAFTPLLVALTFGEPVMKRVATAARAVPRGLLPHWGNVMLDVIRQEPGPGGALLQGLFFGRVAPPRSERRTFEVPTLVLGHPRDPVHPFSDAGMLAGELPSGRLIEANSLVELRMHPERLTDEIAAFLDELWAPPRAARRTKRSTGGAKRSPAKAATKGSAAKKASSGRTQRSSTRAGGPRAARAKRPRSARH
ncbi:MAG TPA: alpha/beta fold hydrolase [Solirubrobacteraceae bacterium]|nr:alpha/beta fold hydrolase [Solirubrobacteraceae bacterium]